MKNIAILGSTGSIGKSALSLIEANADSYNVVAISANRNEDLIKQQILKFKPNVVAMANADSAQALNSWLKEQKKTNGLDTEVLAGANGVCAVASYEKADFVLSAIVGASGLEPTLAAIRAKKTIGLANKETLVMAGPLVLNEAAKHNVSLLPVDSEHSAIFQCLEGRRKEDVRRLVLTASGGPFFGKTKEDLVLVTAADALKHPNWSMGSKITVDSATLMNKGLEVIEAHYLFDFTTDQIDVIVHPQSIIHSMIELKDGALMAQLSVPDMKGPIGYALSYPRRIDGAMNCCRLEDIGALTFYPPDKDTFPCLRYAYDALNEGGTMPTVLNGANEEVVALFLKGIVNFLQIPAIIGYVMEKHKNTPADNLATIFAADKWARQAVNDKVKGESK
ncbi:MAG: 1-deoxy-D-xylulose-5-phosphate reductoisomerase [Candidatus Magnetoovum sp. WYHC-5]|nr:1-deoxy-D-xylulose-5-phosphate reductoisomerase [Candidatus Magnetoovum sp. WYHC-5]